MEDKRGTKHPRSPSNEGSSSPSRVSTPPPTSSRSSPPLGSLLEVSSCRHCSPVFKQDGPFEKAPMVDLSSFLDEEGLIPGTSRDEFTRRLFGDLNRDVLGPSGDSKVIILSRRCARRMSSMPKLRHLCCKDLGLNCLRRRRRCSTQGGARR
jgi:hypothetical protein